MVRINSYISIEEMVKEQYRETDVIRKIAKVSFGVESAQQIQQQAHIHMEC